MDYDKHTGTKAEVFHGTAKMTSGRLTKDLLMRNKRGRIVSKAAHKAGKEAYDRNNLHPKTARELDAIRGAPRKTRTMVRSIPAPVKRRRFVRQPSPLPTVKSTAKKRSKRRSKRTRSTIGISRRFG